MPLIHLGQAAWNTVPAQGGAPARALPGSGTGSGGDQVAMFAGRVADQIQSAKSRGLTAGVTPGDLLVLLQAESQETAKRHRSARPTRFTEPGDLSRLISGVAANDQVLFLICGNLATSLARAADAGYAATLLRAGSLANAIVSAALECGWSASMDFASQYAVTAAVRQMDRLAIHLGTVRACPGGRA